MGSMSEMRFIDRVLSKHGDAIRAERLHELSAQTQGLVVDLELKNNVHTISIVAVLSNGTRLDLLPLDFDFLAEEYPDCGVGY